MTGTDVRGEIAVERRELAAVLRDLPAAAWEAPTLCAGWRPREVVANLTMPFHYSRGQVAWQLVRARGSFNRWPTGAPARTRSRCRYPAWSARWNATPGIRGSRPAAGTRVR